MPEFNSLRMSEHGHALFSAAEIEGLMRVEFERAQRHKIPLVCMLLAIDRLGQLQDLYGFEAKDDIVRAVIDALRGAMRDSDHLGRLDDDRLLAVFTHTTPEIGAMLGKRLLASAKKLRFERDGRTLRVSLSIGVAHNRHESATSFETLLAVAEEGLAVADAGGGDRFVETELYQLHERKRRARLRAAEREAEGGAYVAPATPVAPPAPAPTPSSQARPDDFGRTLLSLLGTHGFSEDELTRLAPETIAAALRAWSERQMAPAAGSAPEAADNDLVGLDKDAQIQLLERRLAKLTQVLGFTEEELRRIAAMKGLDSGLASIYRTVQGLSSSEEQFARKRDLMRSIFEANTELKRLRAEAKASS